MKKISKLIAVILSSAALLISLTERVSAAPVTTAICDNSNELQQVYSDVGHLQFNVAAGSNINSKGDRGYSHVESMAKYEKSHNTKLLGNSSGGYLDGSNNEGGEILKAYLIIETSTVDYSLPDYPITFVSGSTGQKMETKVHYYNYTEFFSQGNERRMGWIDCTDFIKQNGYGWYYCCNIPYNTDGASWNSDQFAGWKLIVIEENYDLPMRMLKLKIGCQNIMGEGESASIVVNGGGIRTARINDVTGQFLFGMAGADPGDIQANSIQYACDSVDSEKDLNYKTFSTVNGVRTEKNPLTFISSRNGIPLATESRFENPVYFKDGKYSTMNENGSFQAGSGDLELLDISTTSGFYHNVSLDRDKTMVGFQFKTVTDCALMTDVMGIAVDIDVPSYDHECTISYDKDSNQFIVDGVLSNITDLYDVGISSPEFVFQYDKDLTVTSYEARITSLYEDDSARVERILSHGEMVLDKGQRMITFKISGLDKGQKDSGINKKNDIFYYRITMSVNTVRDYYENQTYINGSLVSSGTDTGLYLNKLAARLMKNSLDGVITKKSLSGKIIWEDSSDENHMRPKTVKVSLCMDSVAISGIDITGSGNIWEYSFDDLDIYKTLDYQYEYEALIKEEYDGYDVSYNGSDILFRLKEKHIPTNNVLEDSVSLLEKAITDMTPFGLNLHSISEAYGVFDEIEEGFKNSIN